MPAIVCPWCSTMSSMSVHGRPSILASRVTKDGSGASKTRNHFQSAFVCNNSSCKRFVIADAWGSVGQKVEHASDEHYWDTWSGVTWAPSSVGGRQFPDVPEHIASAADEAFRCKSIGAFRASIILARAVVEGTAKERGITSGQIVTKINELAKAGHVRDFTRDAAHELRHLGNNMAHGDFIDPVDEEDCEAVLAVMAEILDEVYQGPARVTRMRMKRLGVEKAGDEPAAGSDDLGQSLRV